MSYLSRFLISNSEWRRFADWNPSGGARVVADCGSKVACGIEDGCEGKGNCETKDGCEAKTPICMRPTSIMFKKYFLFFHFFVWIFVRFWGN